MEGTDKVVLSNIQQYASEVRRAQQHHMDIDTPDRAAFEARLDQTVKELEDRVARQRAALDKVGHVIFVLIGI